MRRGVIKLLLSLVATAAAATSLVASTFAYVLINNKVVVPDFDFDVRGQEGLQISLDNKSWTQDILASQLKESMSDDFDKIKFSCVTVKHDDNGNIEKDVNNQIKFIYDEVDGQKNAQGNMIYRHIATPAGKNEDNGFIKFDLYLKSKSTFAEKKNFTLMMTENTKISSGAIDVKISNRLSTLEKNYNPGETVSVDIANAVRMGIYNVDTLDNTTFATYNDFKIYEMTNEYDLGSVALESHRGLNDKNDPEKNAMYTYYNNYFVKYPFPTGASDGEAFNTRTREELLNDTFGSFKYSEELNDYNVIKLECYIWVEGWDADYFVGIPDETTIRVDLEFKIV